MPARSSYDVVVIGGGVGGSTAARILAEKGFNVLLVEEGLIGGECLNYGCVPFKTLYKLVEATHTVTLYSPNKGQEAPGFGEALERARRITDELRRLLASNLEGLGVEVARGRGWVCGPHETCIEPPSSPRVRVGFRKLIVATGSEPLIPPRIMVDEERVVTNRGFLGLNGLPERLIVVGGGAVGVEAASIAAGFGSRVVLVEALREILPFMDRSVSRRLRLLLGKRGVGFRLGRRVSGVTAQGGSVEVALEDGSRLEADAALIAIGRRPRSRGLGLEEAGVQLDDRGYILVDEKCRTSNPDIYAVGDVTGPPMLAHKAIAEAQVAALDIAGAAEAPRRPEPWRIPAVVYSTPPAGGVGYTEDEARRAGGHVRSVRLPFGVSARAWIEGWEKGLLKLVYIDGRLMGVHAVGPQAGELVAAAAPLLGRRLAPRDIPVYPHMSILETLREALLRGSTGA